MKTVRTINKEIEAQGFSILAKYDFNFVNGYFNFYQTHTRNTFIFREFVRNNQKQSFINSLTNKEFVLVFIDREIRAYRSFKNLENGTVFFSYLYNEEEEYDNFLNEYIITF